MDARAELVQDGWRLMPDHDRPRLLCFLAIPYVEDFKRVREAIQNGARQAGFRPISFDEPHSRDPSSSLAAELARADCVIADVTHARPNVFYELGLAQAMGKPLFILSQDLTPQNVPFGLLEFDLLTYEPSPSGLEELKERLSKALKTYRRFPHRARQFAGHSSATPFFVDWDLLDQPEAENLCLELLAQMGYRRVDWEKESREFDLIAEVPKKDPDGFEYRELWLVAMGRNAPPEMLLDMLAHEPDFLVHRLMRDGERFERLMSRGQGDIPVTILIILLKGAPEQLALFDAEDFTRRLRRRTGPYPISFRIRVWDRNYLTSLVQQSPQIGFKYFSEEGRSQSRYRKTPEELYRENVDLAAGLAKTVAALEDEKNRRVRAERDAVWKDISFSAAHKIGNPNLCDRDESGSVAEADTGKANRRGARGHG